MKPQRYVGYVINPTTHHKMIFCQSNYFPFVESYIEGMVFHYNTAYILDRKYEKIYTYSKYNDNFNNEVLELW